MSSHSHEGRGVVRSRKRALNALGRLFMISGY